MNECTGNVLVAPNAVQMLAAASVQVQEPHGASCSTGPSIHQPFFWDTHDEIDKMLLTFYIQKCIFTC